MGIAQDAGDVPGSLRECTVVETMPPPVPLPILNSSQFHAVLPKTSMCMSVEDLSFQKIPGDMGDEALSRVSRFAPTTPARMSHGGSHQTFEHNTAPRRPSGETGGGPSFQ